MTDAFGTGDYALEGRCGFVFHVSCWALLEKVFHPSTIPCPRLYEVCQSLPSCDGFFSWGHNYGGLTASDIVHNFPWNAEERFLEPPEYDDQSITPESGRASVVNFEQGDMSRTRRRIVSEGIHSAGDGSEIDTDVDEPGLSVPSVPPQQHRQDNLTSYNQPNESPDEQSDNSRTDSDALEGSSHRTYESMRDVSGRPTSRDTAIGPAGEHMGCTMHTAPVSLEEAQNSDVCEGKANESDNIAIQEEHPVAENCNESLDAGQNLFVGLTRSTAGVLPRSSPSDSCSVYDPSDDSDHETRLPLVVPNSDPYEIPEVGNLLTEDCQLPPVSPIPNTLFTGDVFAILPEEIRTAVAEYLVTSDVYNLRAASRSFWHVFYSQQFWKSRFTFLHPDRSWLFEALDDNQIRDWRYLYRRTSNLSSYPALQNRKRIWPLAIRILDILSLDDSQQLEKHDLAADSHTNLHDTENFKSIEVAGLIFSDPIPSRLRQGCRVMHRQQLSLPKPVKLDCIAFSFVYLGNTTYISGLRFESSNFSKQIGYRSPIEHSLTLVSHLRGWRIAVGARGIQAIQCVLTDTEAESPWFGSFQDACITDRLADCAIQTVDFGLDVSFSLFPSPFVCACTV